MSIYLILFMVGIILALWYAMTAGKQSPSKKNNSTDEASTTIKVSRSPNGNIKAGAEKDMKKSMITKAIIPLSPNDLGGASVSVDQDFEIKAKRGWLAMVDFYDLPPEIDWFVSYELMYCQVQHDPQIIKVIRKARDDEYRTFRVPWWIQDEEIPECCGQHMVFVGQIDDDSLCEERPDDAERWWHDSASFYVFTCPKCLGVKAVGQQF